MVHRKLARLAWSAVTAVAVSACADQPEPAVPKEQRVHPEIVTSAIPTAQENREVESQRALSRRERDSAAEEAERVAEAVRQERERPFYEPLPGADKEYELESLGQADAAFERVMQGAIEPFRPPGPSSDIENPTNQPSERGAKGWGEQGATTLLTCQPGVPLKRGKTPNAPNVVRLPIGTVLPKIVDEPSEESAEADEAPLKPNSKTPPRTYAHVDAGNGRTGWVDESMTRELSLRDPAEAYLACCAVVRDSEKETGTARERFATRAEYIACLNRGMQAFSAPQGPAALAYEYTMAIARAASLIERSQSVVEPYKTFLARYGGQLAWSPDGYALTAKELWALEEKYHGTEAGEALAWQAAHDGVMDRTCNREVACNVQQARARWGEYLARYPSGPHAREAIDVIIAMRPRDENDTTLPLDRNAQSVEQCLRTLGELSSIVDNTRAVGRVQASGALEALRRFVLARSGHIEGRR